MTAELGLGTEGSPFDATADAVAGYDARPAADPNALRSKPWFRPAVKQGDRWEVAQQKAEDAAAPYVRALDTLIAQNSSGCLSNAKTEHAVAALRWKIQHTRMGVLAEHGFTLTPPPATPEELARELAEMDLKALMDRIELGCGVRPEDVWQHESLKLWDQAEIIRAEHGLPRLPQKPKRGCDRILVLAKWCDLCAAHQAYTAAETFIYSLSVLAFQARHYQSRPEKPDAWKDLGGTYAEAFIAGYDLPLLLTQVVRDAARGVYAPGAPSIKVGQSRAKQTYIEAVSDELATYFRNVLYAERRTPFDPDFVEICRRAPKPNETNWEDRQVWIGQETKKERLAIKERFRIKTWTDALMLMDGEWKSQTQETAELRLASLRLGAIDFDDLRAQLGREARAVLSAGNEAMEQTVQIPSDTLTRFEAVLTGLPALLQSNQQQQGDVAAPKGLTRKGKKRGPYKVGRLTKIEKTVLDLYEKHDRNMAKAANEYGNYSTFVSNLERADRKAVILGMPSVLAGNTALTAIRSTRSVKARSFAAGEENAHPDATSDEHLRN